METGITTRQFQASEGVEDWRVLGEGADAVLEHLARVAEADRGAFLLEGLRDPPGDGPLVGDAEDQRLLSAHQAHGRALSIYRW